VCTKRPRRKKQEPKIIHVVGKLVELILGKLIVPKYANIESHVIIITIGYHKISNVLADLGATINIITFETMTRIGFTKVIPTSTLYPMA